MRLSSIAVATLLACLAGASQAATFNVVRLYDENTNQTNAINSDVTGTLAAFTADIANSFDSFTGGVVNFDLPDGSASNLTNQASFTVGYGAGNSNTLTVTPSTNAGQNLNFSTFTSITPISGSSASDSKGLLTSDSNANILRLTFSGLPEGRLIQQIGFTVLSRDAKGQQYKVDVYVNGETVTPFTTLTDTIAAGKGVDDSFFSFAVPDGSGITSIRLSLDLGGTIAADDRLGIDDLAFITVPEPSAVGFLGLAMLALLRPRRR